MSDKVQVILRPSKGRNYITTTAIGESYFSDFKKYSMPSWIEYCNKFGLGLAVVVGDLVSCDNRYYKKANWQKFLVGRELQVVDSLVDNICHLDTDIIISPIAPNIFEFHDVNRISVISLREGLPFSYDLALKRMAFFRNKFYDKKYPLDSALFIDIENLYKCNGLEVPKIADETCSGVYVFNAKKYSDFFEQIFYLYTKDINTTTNGGDQTHFNYHVLNNSVKFLPYKFQAIWAFEQAINYPFLYYHPDQKLIDKCINSSLMDNYFLHFAGSWHESDMWKSSGILNKKNSDLIQSFTSYLDTEVVGNPVGMVRP